MPGTPILSRSAGVSASHLNQDPPQPPPTAAMANLANPSTSTSPSKAKHVSISFEKDASAAIDLYLMEEKKKYSLEVKEPRMLLLGSSDSGKSTLLKQLRILHSDGFTADERTLFGRRIQAGILSSISLVLENLRSLRFNENQDLIDHYTPFQTFCESWREGKLEGKEGRIDKEEFLRTLKEFWEEKGVQDNLEGSHLPDTIAYFFGNLDRIFNPLIPYVPTNQDILNLRTVTQTVTDSIFTIESGSKTPLKLHVIDVSGLSHHRARWISYFDDVKCVVFVASLSCYDQNMAEEKQVNRMVDSLVLFESMVNHPLLNKKDFVLLLNKRDLFEEKIKKKNIVEFFPAYKGKAGNVAQALAYFDGKFRDRNAIQKTITTHVTCCNDTMIMRVIIPVILQSIMTGTMAEVGFV